MKDLRIFNFDPSLKVDEIPEVLNNPFVSKPPVLAQKAAKDFQGFLSRESQKWGHDFHGLKGKMFGVLVIHQQDNSLGYLATGSGKLPNNQTCERFVPSVFDDSTDDYFINRGMRELTALSEEIKNNPNQAESLTELRSQKSNALQRRLFENYHFLNIKGTSKNVLEIFELSSHGSPPAAAGECAAPKLLNYAFQHDLKPIALAEFWWGKSPKNEERIDRKFYPACRNKCRPILEFMLQDESLYSKANDK